LNIKLTFTLEENYKNFIRWIQILYFLLNYFKIYAFSYNQIKKNIFVIRNGISEMKQTKT
jgi:hypothetical protein